MLATESGPTSFIAMLQLPEDKLREALALAAMKVRACPGERLGALFCFATNRREYPDFPQFLTPLRVWKSPSSVERSVRRASGIRTISAVPAGMSSCRSPQRPRNRVTKSSSNCRVVLIHMSGQVGYGYIGMISAIPDQSGFTCERWIQESLYSDWKLMQKHATMKWLTRSKLQFQPYFRQKFDY